MMASKPTDLKVIVYNVVRGPVSPMGNPSYTFRTDHGPYRTQADLGASYGLENDFTVGETIDLPVTLTLSPRGRVIDWTL